MNFSGYLQSSSESIAPVELVSSIDGIWRPRWCASDPLLQEYYDQEWGQPVVDERGIYERIVLESFQAGLSWSTILRKRLAFREAFDNFCPDQVATYTEDDIVRLISDDRIIRNRAKISAAINNAHATVLLRNKGGLAELIWRYRSPTISQVHYVNNIPSYCYESTMLARELKQEGFIFVGPTTMFALMQAIGLVKLPTIKIEDNDLNTQ